MCAKDIRNWDSLTNIKLIITIEKEFNIKYEPHEIVIKKNVGELIKKIKDSKIIKNKISFRAIAPIL